MPTEKARRSPAEVQKGTPGASAWDRGPAPPPKPLEWHHRLALSGRERDICELVPTRLSYKEMARILGISESTVKTNMRRILLKTGTANRYALISALYAAGFAPQLKASRGGSR